MAERILIARGGEIAVRVARTCKRFGQTAIVRVHDANENGVHVDAADGTLVARDAHEIGAYAKDIALVKSRIGHPGDVAALSALLMSEEGSFITGQSIAIDGGVTLRP